MNNNHLLTMVIIFLVLMVVIVHKLDQEGATSPYPARKGSIFSFEKAYFTWIMPARHK